MQALEIWTEYRTLHRMCPDPCGSLKGDFYEENSANIRLHNLVSTPQAAVVIPAYNESTYLGRTLAGVNNALRQLNYPTRVIVVNNASTDCTEEIARGFGAIIVNEPTKGIGRARQAGLEATPSTASVILTTDSDGVVPPDWITQHIQELQRKGVVCTFGEAKRCPDFAVRGLTNYLLMLYVLGANYMHAARRLMGVKITPGSNMAFTRAAGFEIGGYSIQLAAVEDYDLSTRLSRLGQVKFINCAVLVSGRRVLIRGVGRTFLERVLGNIRDPLLQEMDEITFTDYREPETKPPMNHPSGLTWRGILTKK